MYMYICCKVLLYSANLHLNLITGMYTILYAHVILLHIYTYLHGYTPIYIYIYTSVGRSLVAEESGSGDVPGRNASVFIQSLLDLRDTYQRFLQDSFSGHQLFKNAIASVSSARILSL